METAKHFGSKLRKTLAALLATMALMAVLLPGALAVDLNVDVGFYFKQSRGGTCTLASAAMMLRSLLKPQNPSLPRLRGLLRLKKQTPSLTQSPIAAGPIWTGWTAGWM